MAVHHITEADLSADTPVCTEDLLHKAVWGGIRPDVLVAHNCEFERKFFPDSATEGLPWICTLKAALRIWPDAPGHSNQVLRYWRNLGLDQALAMPPDRAAPDAWVTANLLVEMLKVATIEQPVEWTLEPKFMPKMTFGKHRGLAWAEVPLDYLQWMTGQRDMDPDAIWWARQEIERRRQPH